MGQLFSNITKEQLANAEVLFIVGKFNSFANVQRYYLDAVDCNKVAAFKAAPMSASSIRSFFVEHKKNYPNVKLVLISDSTWFKALAKKPKCSPTIGTFYTIEDDSEFNSIAFGYIPDISEIMYNPQIQEDISFIFKNVKSFLEGTYVKPGVQYKDCVTKLTSVNDIKTILYCLLDYKELACDIETTSLYVDETGISSIAFSPTDDKAYSFTVSFNHTEEETKELNKALKEFFINYKGKLIFHNGSFDVTIIVNTLFMREEQENKYKAMYYGLDVILRDYDDTKLMAYLCYNSCVRPELGLKYLCKKHLGDYALYEVDNISKYSEDELLQYNGYDTMGTMFVFNDLRERIVKEDQVDIYENFYKKALYELIVMQLVGLPLDPDAVAHATQVTTEDYESAKKAILEFPLVKEFSLILKKEYVEKKNAVYKKKQITVDDCEDIQLNPDSGAQVKRFLYEFLKLPVIECTKTGAPSTEKETLTKLLEETKDDNIKAVLAEFIKLADVAVIKKNFIKNFNRNPTRLYGYFNLGTVVSGRLSATNNLQTIPSKGTRYADLIKQCFKVPKGYLLIGIDYSSLEDFISALLTKDSNKLKVYMPIAIYKVEVDGETYYLSDDDEVVIDGVSYKPSQLCKS